MTDQQPDPRPGAYYVSVVDGPRHQILAGPFGTHAETLARVEECRRLANELDPRAHWYAFGACRVEGGTRPGILNARLELK